jgi:hypothetical protein
VAVEKEQALAALRAEHEQRIAELTREQTAAMTRRVRDGLLLLAQYRAKNPEKPA